MKKTISTITIFTLLCTLMLSFFVTPASAESLKTNTSPSGINLDNIETEINDFMQNNIGKSAPGAAVAVVKDGEIIFSQGYGSADIENNIAVDNNTVFEYGSISKLFVWISAMQLVEQGKLDLDTDIRTYLPEDFNKQWKINYPITMRNIMNHSSGYGEYTFDLIDSNESSEEIGLGETILNSHPEQYFKPGTASVYSNYATALAGYVVECISGQEFYSYQKEYIFDKINMNNTAGQRAWKDNISIIDSKSQGYTMDGKGGFVNTGWSYVGLYPAGSVNGTVGDLAKLAIALMPQDNQTSPLFNESITLSTMLSPSYDQGDSGMAHGFFEYDSALGNAFGHGGNTVSFSTQLVFVPEEQFGLVVLTNASSELDILYGLQELLVGSKKADSSITIADLPDANNVTGSYISMRRPEKTLMEFSSYLSTATVEAIDSNTIQFNMMIFSGKYIQTAPYVFELIESSHPIISSVYNKLVFKMENDTPTQILIGNGMDMSAYPSHRTPLTLTLNVVTLVICILFFLIAPIVILISAIKNRKSDKIYNKKFNTAKTCLTLCGTALLLNNAIMIIFLLTNQMVSYSQVLPFGIINYILAFISVVPAILGFLSIKNKTTKSQKIGFVIAFILLASFISVLVSWNMFVVYI